MAAPTISTASSFNMTRDKICQRALRLLQAIEAGETPGADLMATAVEALNAWTKEQQATGLHLWTETEGVVIPVPGQNSYALGTGTPDMAVNGPLYGVLSAGNAAGSTVINLVAPPGTVDGDTLAILSAAGQFTLSTITAIGASTVTIAAPGLLVAANQNAPVLTWHSTATMSRPLRVLSLRRYNLQSKINVPLMPLARLDFRGLPNQQQPGVINSWFYDPQLTFGRLWLWLSPQNPIGDVCNITYMRPLNDWTNPSNIGDFPQEWLSCIAYNLAVEMLPEFGVPTTQAQLLIQMAAQKLDICQGFDKEPESVFFGYASEPGFFR